jgi:hypothetical protein
LLPIFTDEPFTVVLYEDVPNKIPSDDDEDDATVLFPIVRYCPALVCKPALNVFLPATVCAVYKSV